MSPPSDGPWCSRPRVRLLQTGPLAHSIITKSRPKGNRHLPVFTFDFSGPHPHRVNVAQYLLVCVWSLGHMRLVWACGIESRQATVVLPCLQASFDWWFQTTYPSHILTKPESFCRLSSALTCLNKVSDKRLTLGTTLNETGRLSVG